jgi:hypothetical protein
MEIMLLGGLILGGTVVLLALIIGGFTQANRARMLEHQERMKALEMGHPLPDDPATARIKAKAAWTIGQISAIESPETSKSFAYQCYSITGYISGAGFFFAMVAGGPIAYALSAASGAIGVTGIICGTILAAKETRQESPTLTKPRFDPESV